MGEPAWSQCHLSNRRVFCWFLVNTNQISPHPFQQTDGQHAHLLDYFLNRVEAYVAVLDANLPRYLASWPNRRVIAAVQQIPHSRTYTMRRSWTTENTLQDIWANARVRTNVPCSHIFFCPSIHQTSVEVCRALQDVLSQLLCNLEADARDLADLMIIDERGDIVPFVIVSCVWWYQCRLTVGLVKVANKLREKLVSRNAYCCCVAQVIFKLLSNVLSQVAG